MFISEITNSRNLKKRILKMPDFQILEFIKFPKIVYFRIFKLAKILCNISEPYLFLKKHLILTTCIVLM